MKVGARAAKALGPIAPLPGRAIPILVDVYFPRAHPPTERVRVGWSGSPSTAPNLRLIRSSLTRWSARSDIEFRFIGGGTYDLPWVRFTDVPWTAETEVDELSRLDVGLLPAPRMSGLSASSS